MTNEQQPPRPSGVTMSVTWVGPFRPAGGRTGDTWDDPETGRRFLLGATPDEDRRIA